MPISLMGSLRIWKEHKKLVNNFLDIFLFSSICSKILPLKHVNFSFLQKNFRSAWGTGTQERNLQAGRLS